MFRLREKYSFLQKKETSKCNNFSKEDDLNIFKYYHQYKNNWKFENTSNENPSLGEQSQNLELEYKKGITQKTQEGILDSYFNINITKDLNSTIFPKHSNILIVPLERIAKP